MTDEDKSEQLSIDYRNTFGTESGQRVLADILFNCRMWQSGLNANADPNVALASEAMRNVGVMILTKMKFTPKDILEAATDDFSL